jgi:hypothetical protein
MKREEILQLAQELELVANAVAVKQPLSQRAFQSYVLRALAMVLRLLVRP